MAIQLYKRTNAKASSEKDPKDPSKQKWNAGAVCVKIDDEYIPVSELAKLANLKRKKANAFEVIEKVENEMELDGETHDMGNLINLYRSSKQNMTDKEDPALQAAIKGMKKYDSKGNEVAQAVEDNEDEAKEKAMKMNKEEDEDMKENEDAGEKELEKGEGPDEGSSKVVTQKNKAKNTSDVGFVKDTKKKQNEEDEDEKENEFVSEKNSGKKNKEEDEDMKENEDDEDEDVKESIKKQSKSNNKDVRHFIRMNSARENGSAEPGTLTIDTLHNRIDRGKLKYGSQN